MDISETLVAENIQLRQEVARLNERIEEIHERHVDEWVSAKAFLQQFYGIMAIRIPGEWKEIGDSCNWTAEQIAIAENLACQTRQELYAKAREFES